MLNTKNYFGIMMWVFLFSFIAACNNNNKNKNQMKFDKAKWNEREDPAFPPTYRLMMLDDLITNNKIVGLTYKEVKLLLGTPDFSDSNSLAYTIVEEYGKNIDPIYTKHLKVYFSNDSIISSLKINEWKK